MIKNFALTVGLALTFSLPASAETYVNPDQEWWGIFFQAVNGTTVDYEAIAKQDTEYLAADEFDRETVLQGVIARLQDEQATIDLVDAEVTISIGAKLGDFSDENNGFPVDTFSQNMHLKFNFDQLFFRNWSDFNIFPATPDEGRALRERIGQQALTAEVTMRNFQKSNTRSNAYDGFIVKVAYFAPDGLPIAEFTASEAAPLSDDVQADMVAGSRAKSLISLVSRPWERHGKRPKDYWSRPTHLSRVTILPTHRGAKWLLTAMTRDSWSRTKTTRQMRRSGYISSRLMALGGLRQGLAAVV